MDLRFFLFLFHFDNVGIFRSFKPWHPQNPHKTHLNKSKLVSNTNMEWVDLQIWAMFVLQVLFWFVLLCFCSIAIPLFFRQKKKENLQIWQHLLSILIIGADHLVVPGPCNYCSHFWRKCGCSTFPSFCSVDISYQGHKYNLMKRFRHEYDSSQIRTLFFQRTPPRQFWTDFQPESHHSCLEMSYRIYLLKIL